ncbi:MAG: threonine ammonia-lyase [Hyphomicrobiaceae bacterium]|nr:threonine ammonia-lyase [Hyphomicrobiaceae bacterium]
MQEAVPSLPVSLADIERAAGLLAGNILPTPCLEAPKLSRLTGAEVYVKYENLQVTNSFKERGAFIRLSALSEEERRRGVIAMSAGNHAQAVAYHAQRLSIPATIVMPVTTPFVKVASTRSRGANVILEGETLAEAQIAVERLIAAHDFVLIHPYDDPAVIAGQGTIGLEMLSSVPGLDDLIVPVGGGGLISGIAIAARAIKPTIRITGVESVLFPSMGAALGGREVRCGGNTLAEGIAVKNVGRLTRAVCEALVDAVVAVGEDLIEQAIFSYLTEQKTMAEGAGAAGLAALLADPERYRGRKVGLVLCGGNIDPRILASIMVRQLARHGQIIALRIEIDDRPGSLGRLTSLIGALGGNILGVSHHRLFLSIPAKGASVDVTLEVRDPDHGATIQNELEAQGFHSECIDIGAADIA